MRRVLVPIVLTLAASGCLAIPDLPQCQPDGDVYWEFLRTSALLDERHGQASDFLFLVQGDNSTGNLTWEVGSNSEMRLERVPSEDGNQSLYIGTFPSGQAGDGSVQLRAQYGVGTCIHRIEKGQSIDRTAKGDGNLAAIGKGAHVYTAGFWTNGTLFYTNMQDLDSSGWPRAGWYGFEDPEPLAVYVYDKDRSERPAQWGQERELGPAGRSVGRNYSTTIEGFNEALKGLSTATERVVVIPPEKAYTLAGREDHPLYGDTLVFYMHVVEVVDVPCPKPLMLDQCGPLP